MKTKINIDDFLILMFWLKTYYFIEGREFKHDALLQQAETYKFNDTPLDTTIHSIDEFVIDSYYLYDKLKSTEDKVNQFLDMFTFLNKEGMIKETNNYKRIFEDIIENFKFENPETRGIQKGMLIEKMNECAKDENYEKAAKLRDMIKIC